MYSATLKMVNYVTAFMVYNSSRVKTAQVESTTREVQFHERSNYSRVKPILE